MQIPFVDLNTQHKPIRKEIDAAIKSVIKSGKFIFGPEVEKFEKETAEYCGTKFAVSVASGTDAIKIALLSCGIEKGDEVITTPFTFIATSETIILCGAKPVFADIDPSTCNIDPAKIESLITKKTKAILPVHLFGHSCDMDKIKKIAKKYNLKIIEDCAQSMGTLYKGKQTGSLGNAGALSFFPSKNLGCFGDGGMVVTNNSETAEKAKIFRNHGQIKKYHYSLHGYNSRLDTIQAAVLSIKLKHLNKWIEKRQTAALTYNKYLANTEIITPSSAPYTTHSFNYYTIKIPGKRNQIKESLAEKGIYTEIYYPLSLHLQEVYKNLGYKLGDFPNAELCQNEVLSLPMHPELKEKQIKYICECILDNIG